MISLVRLPSRAWLLSRGSSMLTLARFCRVTRATAFQGFIWFYCRYDPKCGPPAALSIAQRHACILGLTLAVWRFDALIPSYLNAVGVKSVNLIVTDLSAGVRIFAGTTDELGVVHPVAQPDEFVPSTSSSHPKLFKNSTSEWARMVCCRC